MSITEGMEQIYPGVHRVFPTKITDAKYVTFFVERRGGNLLFPCVSGHSTIEGSFDAIERMGGIALQLIGDMHFAAGHNDDLSARFGALATCSEPEGPDVRRKVKNVATFPFVRQMLAPRVEAIPTPGHRPGAVSYLVTLGKRRYLFAGDSVYHDGKAWRCFTSKKNHEQMRATLALLKTIDFDVLLANTRARNPICSVELDATGRNRLMDEVAAAL